LVIILILMIFLDFLVLYYRQNYNRVVLRVNLT